MRDVLALLGQIRFVTEQRRDGSMVGSVQTGFRQGTPEAKTAKVVDPMEMFK